MKIKKVLAVGMALMLGAGILAGCGGNNADPNAITIRYFVGGYGSTWLEEAMKEYTAETGVTFNPIPDDQVKANINVYLERKVPDIIMTDSFNWQESVYMGKIEPLDEVFEAEVSDGMGGTVKVKDYIVDELQDWPYMQRLRGQGEEHPWVLPWTVLSTGIIYNEAMMKTIPDTVNGGTWQSPPETYDELIQYCKDVEATGKTAIAWAGSDGMHWWKFPTYVWWAQIQGVREPNPLNTAGGEYSEATVDGSWYDFWDFATHNEDESLNYTDGYDVWKQKGLSEALDYVGNLLVDYEKGATGGNYPYRFSPSRPDGLNIKDAQRIFVTGEAAMMFCGSWLENEMTGFISDDVVMKLMPWPTVDGAAVDPETNEPYKINNAQSGDVIIIPRAADETKKEKSKAFLAWLCSGEQLTKFAQYSGSMRPFKYNPFEIDPDYEYSTFNESVFNMYMNSVNLYEVSLNDSDTYKYMRKDVFNNDAMSAYLKLRQGMSGWEIMVTGNTSINSDWRAIYTVIKDDWQKELDQFKIT